MGKTRLALIFGGQSSEHEVSCVSGATVAGVLDREKYDITFIGITKEGHWILVENEDEIADRRWESDITGAPRAFISPDTDKSLVIKRGDSFEVRNIDVAFPVLHGLFGEDGTIQGLFELAHIPYVGCGHLASAITMDKFFTKIIADSIGVAQAEFVGVRAYEIEGSGMDKVVARIEAEREYPVFVKPSCAGSSKGITKAHNREELISGLKLAAENDSKILVEESINGREIECAVFGYGDNAFATGVGEIVAAAEFYDFDAKYNNDDSETIVDPQIPDAKRDEIREKALSIFKACDGFGFSRVDFFIEEGTDRVVFNEINTIPGHTAISMYPMLMKAAGYEMGEYVDKLIEMAYKRHDYR
ncbi:MAG: D-alanine--D-alanine ligase [Eubacterium sp.]|nr:D-alanine--D-alanine ligase [Eubacterium sp.]